MLSSTLLFVALAVLCAVLGFTGAAGTLAWIAQVFFTLFVVLTLVSLVIGRRPLA